MKNQTKWTKESVEQAFDEAGLPSFDKDITRAVIYLNGKRTSADYDRLTAWEVLCIETLEKEEETEKLARRDARRDTASAARPKGWSKVPPAKVGFYWRRQKHWMNDTELVVDCVWVRDYAGDLAVSNSGVEGMGCEWNGPVIPPA